MTLPPRIIRALAVVVAVSAVSAPKAQAPAVAGRTRLDQARVAMGGPAALDAVRTAIITGDDRIPNGWYEFGRARGAVETPEFLVDRFEIRILMPDHYRMVRVNSRSGLERVAGFAGTRALVPSRGPIEWQRENLGRLLLRVFLRTDPVYPIAYRGATGDTLRFTEPDSVEVFIDLDSATSLPRRLRFVRRAQATAEPAASRRFNTVVEISDYRRVQTLLLPHRLVETADGKFARETRFEAIELNPPVTPADFKLP